MPTNSYRVNFHGHKTGNEAHETQRLTKPPKNLSNWLPYRASHQHGNIPHNLTLCPSCQQAPENHWHFLECTNPKREQMHQSLLKDLWMMHMKLNVDMELFYLLQAGLHGIRLDTPIPDATDHFPNLTEQHHQWSCIGWDQFFYGRISVTWAHHINQISSGYTNETIFYSRMIQQIWQYALDVLTSHNLDIHQRNPDLDHPFLANQVQNLLHLTQQDPSLQAMTTEETADRVMNCPIAQIHQWIETVTLHLRHHLAAAQQ